MPLTLWIWQPMHFRQKNLAYRTGIDQTKPAIGLKISPLCVRSLYAMIYRSHLKMRYYVADAQNSHALAYS